MFIEQSHDEVYGCLKGGIRNSGGKRLAISMVEEAWLKLCSSSRALRMFIEQSHDEVYGCLKGGSGNSGEKRLAISMVEEAWLSEKKEV
ncbi:hypothetical protein Tco_0237479 [Tanacetum coccineum]